MSAVGTTLLQSPGWNEGKARNETLGTHRKKKMSSVSEVSPLQGSSTFSQSIYFIILVRLLCVFVWGVSLKS